MLFDPKRHEALAGPPWDEAFARGWIARYADDAQAAFSPERLWQTHPGDAGNDIADTPCPMLYFGAAGVIWALDRLARAGAIAPPIDFAPVVADLVPRNT